MRNKCFYGWTKGGKLLMVDMDVKSKKKKIATDEIVFWIIAVSVILAFLYTLADSLKLWRLPLGE